MVNAVSSSLTNLHAPEVFALKRPCNVLYDNKRFTEAALSVSQANEEDLYLRLLSMPIDVYIENIPQSLLLLDALYSKFFLFSNEADRKQFPTSALKPDRLIRQLIWYLTGELDAGGNKRTRTDWKLVGPRIRSLLRVVHVQCPTVKNQLALEKCQIGKALEGLGLHGLVNFADRSLIEVGEAIKNELSNHYQLVKTLSQQVEKLLHKTIQHHSGIQTAGKDCTSSTYAINDRKGPVPSQSSHQRLMNLKLSEIQGRLQRNEYMLQILQACLHNKDLGSLERILQKRIGYDRDILMQFTYLTDRNATYALASEDPVVSHVLVLFSKGYERLLKLMPNSRKTERGGEEERKTDPCELQDIRSSETAVPNGILHKGDHQAAFSEANGAAEKRYLPCRRYHRSSSSAPAPGNGRTSIQGAIRPNLPIAPLASGWSSSESINNLANGDGIYSSLPCLNDCRHNFCTADGLSRLTTGVDDSQRLFADGLPAADPDGGSSSAYCEQIRQLRSEVQKLREALNCAQNRLKKQQQHSHRGFRLDETNSCNDQDNSHSHNMNLIERYGQLYAKDRVETMNELNQLIDLHDAEDLQTKILLSVIVLSFRFVRQDICKSKEEVLRAVRENTTVRDAENDGSSSAACLLQHVDKYLMEKAKLDDYAGTTKRVTDQLWQTLYDFSALKSCRRLNEFVIDCAKLAWQLSTTKPVHTIDFDDTQFDAKRHTRFHTSNFQAKRVKRYIWPALIEENTGNTACRAVVVT